MAREGVEVEEAELGSRPVTGGFLAATVDMIEQAMQWGLVGVDVYLNGQSKGMGNKDKRRAENALSSREGDL